jgi:LysM repeat protein
MSSPMRRTAAALALALLLPLPSLAGEVVVKPGETLSEIAERYGTSVERLMQLNSLRSAKDLWAGSRIQVPGAGGGSNGRGSKGGGGGRASSGSGNYTVKPGETLSEIAERHGTSVDRLMQLNDLRSAKDLWAGSRIQVPGASPARPASAAAPLNRNARDHKVQPGETLSEIADRYGISMDRLVSLNGLKEPNDLQSGSTLRLKAPTTPAARPRPSTVASKPPAKPTPKAVSTASKPAKPAAVAPAPAASAASKPAAPITTATKPAIAARPVASTTATPATASSAAAATSAGTATAIASARPVTSQVLSSSPTAAAAKPSAAVAKPAAASATKPVSSASAAKPAKPSSPDWRSYGPLQVDWANWQPMGGSFVAPSLNSEGQPLYLAVNCNARRLNATGQSGTWKTWDAPQSDFEQQLITDLCKTKGV